MIGGEMVDGNPAQRARGVVLHPLRAIRMELWAMGLICAPGKRPGRTFATDVINAQSGAVRVGLNA